MEIINNELRLFIKDITLFLQLHSNCTPEKIEPMFQKAYKLYVKYDVENEQAVEADAESRCAYCDCVLLLSWDYCPLCGRVRTA